MAKKPRHVSRYQREEDARQDADEQARKEGQRIWQARMQALLQHGENERKRNLRLEDMLVIVKPFGPSLSQRLAAADIERFRQIKREALGYVDCTLVEIDEDKRLYSVGHLGTVANRVDAEKLIAKLLEEFPWVKFRIEEEPKSGREPIWTTISEVMD